MHQIDYENTKVGDPVLVTTGHYSKSYVAAVVVDVKKWTTKDGITVVDVVARDFAGYHYVAQAQNNSLGYNPLYAPDVATIDSLIGKIQREVDRKMKKISGLEDFKNGNVVTPERKVTKKEQAAIKKAKSFNMDDFLKK